MTALLVVGWLASAGVAYGLTRSAVVCNSRDVWNRHARELTLACCVVLGPVMLLMSLELFLLAEVGRGLGVDSHRHF